MRLIPSARSHFSVFVDFFPNRRHTILLIDLLPIVSYFPSSQTKGSGQEDVRAVEPPIPLTGTIHCVQFQPFRICSHGV